MNEREDPRSGTQRTSSLEMGEMKRDLQATKKGANRLRAKGICYSVSMAVLC
jgi:hypothetical protein